MIKKSLLLIDGLFGRILTKRMNILKNIHSANFIAGTNSLKSNIPVGKTL